MEEELHYSTVVFRTNNVSPCENRSKYLPLIASVCLGILSLILISAVIYLVSHPIPQMERRVEALTRERDALNWTLNVITGMENFPVKEYCSQKVCRPCQTGWVFFGSSCYFFSTGWKKWQDSQDYCLTVQAQLVVIQTQEEQLIHYVPDQEFISSRTLHYYDDTHGYWTGLRLDRKQWIWVDGSKHPATYWVGGSPSSGECVLTLNRTHLASWSSGNCYVKNRWICESQALMMTV
ncbi:C-type lectin domain family 4 member M [Merluccius polli]|uniref:C-type lectin domain family 4 member M n=1 Tax=Merluccius polli TaxID=89951 RepID=A0AA47NAN4_MERPO|nr:C-type lectin domain family 4 member M [Merluccius polli]